MGRSLYKVRPENAVQVGGVLHPAGSELALDEAQASAMPWAVELVTAGRSPSKDAPLRAGPVGEPEGVALSEEGAATRATDGGSGATSLAAGEHADADPGDRGAPTAAARGGATHRVRKRRR